MRFSIIIPTTGRESLRATLLSLHNAGISSDDDVIVVADGLNHPYDDACRIAEAVMPKGERGRRPVYATQETRDWGMSQRNHGMAFATGDYLLFIDDDDVYLPGALTLARYAAAEANGAPIIARTLSERFQKAWPPDDVTDASLLVVGMVGTENLIVPNVPDLLPEWPSAYAGDGLFAVEMMRRFAEAGRPAVMSGIVMTQISAHEEDGAWGSVAIATRITQYPDPGFFNCWTRLMREGLRAGDQIIDAPIGRAAHQAANAVIGAFMNEERYAACDTLCFVDYDQGFTPDTLERLRDDHRGSGLGMLGALYMARQSMVPLVYRQTPDTTWDDPLFDVYDGWRRGDVVDVDCCPLGFTLIRRRLLLDVGGTEGPWFWYVGPLASEDVSFSRAARLNGTRLGIHTGVPIQHIIRGVLDPYPSEATKGSR